MTGDLPAPLDLTVLMYHYVRDPGDAAEGGSRIPGLPPRVFAEQLDSLASRYTFIDWPSLRAHLLHGSPLPPRPVLLTFDDGVRDHYHNVFPLLRTRGLSGLFFALARRPADGHPLPFKLHFLIAALGPDGLRAALWPRLTAGQQARLEAAEAVYAQRWPGRRVDILKSCLQRELCPELDPLLSDLYAAHIGDEHADAERYYLDASQVEEMVAGGMHFGGHSRSHPWFDYIAALERQREIEASARWLSAVEPGPWAFAYPYGGLHPDAPAQLDARGFAAAFTTRAQSTHSNRYYLGRYDGEDPLPARPATEAA